MGKFGSTLDFLGIDLETQSADTVYKTDLQVQLETKGNTNLCLSQFKMIPFYDFFLLVFLILCKATQKDNFDAF